MYLRDPRRSFDALRQHLKPSGTLTCIEPFAVHGNLASLEKLRQHTQSIHGGFTHEQLTSFVSGMEIVRQCNCYWSSPDQLLKTLWTKCRGPATGASRSAVRNRPARLERRPCHHERGDCHQGGGTPT